MFQSLVGSTALGLLVVAALTGCSKQKCEACTQDSDCASGLVCHPELKICRAEGNKPSCPVECLKSEGCMKGGLCTLKGGKCVVGEDDCRQSAQCTDEGKCTRKDLGEFGMCVTINPEDCQKSTFCRTKGHCSVDRKSRQCQALSDADCERAEICTADKKCKAQNGECVAAAP